MSDFQFEKALSELQSIVEAMDKNQLSLKEAVEYFERGMQLTKECQAALRDAEQKVQLLMGPDDVARPLDAHLLSEGDKA